jgi:hypothetical protein
MSKKTEPIPSGETLAIRLAGSCPSLWGVLFAMILGFALLTLGVGCGILALAVFRESMVFGLFMAAVALFPCGFGLLILAKGLGELRIAVVVAPTIVETSAHTLHPGQAVEILVVQAGPLRSKNWRVALVGEEHTVVWGTAPDPYNAQGNIIQPYSQSRPLSVIEIAQRHKLTIIKNEEYRERWTFSIPLDAVPQTWSSERSVTWGIVIQGDVNGWPKFKRVFPIAVIGEPAPGVC